MFYLSRSFALSVRVCVFWFDYIVRNTFILLRLFVALSVRVIHTLNLCEIVIYSKLERVALSAQRPNIKLTISHIQRDFNNEIHISDRVIWRFRNVSVSPSSSIRSLARALYIRTRFANHVYTIFTFFSPSPSLLFLLPSTNWKSPTNRCIWYGAFLVIKKMRCCFGVHVSVALMASKSWTESAKCGVETTRRHRTLAELQLNNNNNGQANEKLNQQKGTKSVIIKSCDELQNGSSACKFVVNCAVIVICLLWLPFLDIKINHFEFSFNTTRKKNTKKRMKKTKNNALNTNNCVCYEMHANFPAQIFSRQLLHCTF